LNFHASLSEWTVLGPIALSSACRVFAKFPPYDGHQRSGPLDVEPWEGSHAGSSSDNAMAQAERTFDLDNSNVGARFGRRLVTERRPP